MNIAVIGTGTMGSAMARQLVQAGYGVAIAGRDLGKARTLAASLGPQATAADARTAAASTDVVVLAVHYGDAGAVLASLGPIAVPGVRLVKAFNTILAQVLHEGGKVRRRPRASIRSGRRPGGEADGIRHRGADRLQGHGRRAAQECPFPGTARGA